MQTALGRSPANVGARVARQAQPGVARRAAPLQQRRRGSSGVRRAAEEPFNEGAVQVKRLVDRDRREMLGNKIDILDKYTTEFGDPDDDDAPAPPSSSSSSSSSSNGAAAAASAAAAAAASSSSSSGAPARTGAPGRPPAAVATPFGSGGGVSSPFGAGTGSGAARTRSLTEPKGLSPDMSPDPIVKVAPTPGNFFSRITLTQVVLFCTFTSMIGLMLVTFSVVLNSGAVRLAGID